jgi:Mg-chelatase subunit ChlD
VTFEYDASGIATVHAFDVRSGRPLSGDRAMDYKDPNPEKLVPRARPRWVVFTVDVSYSMEGDKLKNARSALVDSARKLLQAGSCKVGVVSFASDASLICQPTTNLAEVESGAAALAPCGWTAMHKGIRLAAQTLERAPQGTDRLIALLTDGMPDEREQTVAAAAEARNKGVTLYNLGVGKEGVDEDFLRGLSPHSLVVDSAADIGEGFSTLLSLPR